MAATSCSAGIITTSSPSAHARTSFASRGRCGALPHARLQQSVRRPWTLPLAMKMKNGRGKLLLRNLLYEHVPRELVDRPKMGFGVPVGDWIRGPLRSWAESLLDAARLRREGFLDSARVTEMWHAHLA